MKLKIGLAGIFAIAALVSLMPLAFAQEGGSGQGLSPNSSSSDHYNGADSVRDSAEHMAAGVEADASSAYHAVKTETKSAAITTEAKAALLKNAQTRHATIHVSTEHGVVTLTGKVDSSATAQHAEEIAARLDGVRAVRNKLKYPAANAEGPSGVGRAPTESSLPAERTPQSGH